MFGGFLLDDGVWVCWGWVGKMRWLGVSDGNYVVVSKDFMEL